MLTLITVSIYCFCIILTGWTLATYFIKKDSQKLIIEEVKKLFDACKKFFGSLTNLIAVLSSHSRSSENGEANSVDRNVLNEDEQPLRLVEPVKRIEAQTLKVRNDEDDDDVALASFSPEVIEVINEEEEKVA